MKHTLTLAVLFAAISLHAEPALLQPESKLWLVGDSTLHQFESSASTINVAMDVVEDKASLFERIRAGKMKSLKVQVPVTGLKSEKSGLDKNLYKALKAEKNPDIVFVLSSYEVTSSTTPNQFPLIAKGELSIAGQTRPIDLLAVTINGDKVRIQGIEEVLMTEYGVKPPSMMAGAIKTRNRVVVHFDLMLSLPSNP